ncbi:MAG TPA: hypothetical protein VHT30_13570 [Acidimicrobiales bacterium]|jgi:hypothetical protein|nr:hypothetical protein [Acidimicrobiales bacterium]
MPTPVGPAPRDPNDPDFWDWDPPGDEVDELDDRPNYLRHPAVATVAIILIGALVLLLFVSIL